MFLKDYWNRRRGVKRTQVGTHPCIASKNSGSATCSKRVFKPAYSTVWQPLEGVPREQKMEGVPREQKMEGVPREQKMPRTPPYGNPTKALGVAIILFKSTWDSRPDKASTSGVPLHVL